MSFDRTSLQLMPCRLKWYWYNAFKSEVVVEWGYYPDTICDRNIRIQDFWIHVQRDRRKKTVKVTDLEIKERLTSLKGQNQSGSSNNPTVWEKKAKQSKIQKPVRVQKHWCNKHKKDWDKCTLVNIHKSTKNT